MSGNKLGLKDKYKGLVIDPTRLKEFRDNMGMPGVRTTGKLERARDLVKSSLFKVAKKSPIGKVVDTALKIGAGFGLGYTTKKPEGKMGGGSVKKYLTGAQVKIAAKAEPKNKIDAKDFAVLRAEKAKGRGMGLQDEKMQPGKIMSAKKGKMAEKKIKKVMKEYKKGKLNIGKSKKKVKSRKQAIAIALAEARKKSKKS